MTKDRRFLLGVHKALNLTFLRYQKLKSFFQNDWESCWKAKISDFQAAGIDPQGIQKFFSERENIDRDQVYDLIESCGARVMILDDQDYPFPLSQISNPPVVLFVKGTFVPDDFPALAVVGSRGITQYGRKAIQKIVGPIAQKGLTIVSGLAMGTDTLAHKCAIQNNTRTIAVLGNAIDTIYPYQNQRFAETLLSEKKGVILSEYFPKTAARPEFFPMRNRIISGLSKATIVIEAAEKSGSLITAQLALEQNRDVFALPGEIFSKQSGGTNRLLLKGEAYPALSGEQILEQLGFTKPRPQKKKALVLCEDEKCVLAAFGDDTKCHINDLIRTTTLPASQITSLLAMLELKGCVLNIGNQTYSKNV